MRVQIPAYCDRWMAGDRYGAVVRVLAKVDAPLVYRVKLDKSGKTVRVLAEDCTEV